MSQYSLENVLSLVEQQLGEVAVALAAGDSVKIQSCCEELQASSIQFEQLVRASGSAALKSASLAKRIGIVATNFETARAVMGRRTVLVEQALHTLLPATKEETYSREKGAKLSRPYGRGPLQSGSFNTIAV